jgi:hypothetical protein
MAPKPPNGTPRPQQQVPVLRTTMLHQFSFAVAPQPGGGRVLTITVPPGEQIVLPFDADPANSLGRAMLAPSIAVPDAPLQ